MIPSKTFIISPVPATLYTNEQLPQCLLSHYKVPI